MGQRQDIRFPEIKDLKLLMPEECPEVEADPETQAGEQITHPNAGARDARQVRAHGNASRRASSSSMVLSLYGNKRRG
jgi:hypothetical protein